MTKKKGHGKLDGIGPTGDQGEIIIGIGSARGYIMMTFGTQLETLGMTPAQAMDIGNALVKRAKALLS